LLKIVIGMGSDFQEAQKLIDFSIKNKHDTKQFLKIHNICR
jgi:hypothetical protein